MKILWKHTRILDVIEGQLKENMDLCVEDGRIVAMGVDLDCDADEIIDGREKLLTPGFINAHTHLGMSLLRNLADDMELHSWLNDAIWPFEAKMTGEDIYWGTKLSLAELIDSGVTCYCDMYGNMDRVGDATLEAGMRGVLTLGMIEDDKKEMRLRTMEELYKNYHRPEEGIKVAAAPHAIYTCGGEFIKDIMAIADNYDGSVHIHMSETIKEVEDCEKAHGMTPVCYVESLGMLEHRVIAAHCVHMTEEELDLVKDKPFYPVNNPTSNLKLASGFAPVEAMLKRNIKVCIGTDGSSSNNNQNLLEEMHIASILNKAVTMDPKAVPAIEVLRMATINGAYALGWEEEIGSLEVGKSADIVVFDLESPSFTPKNNLVNALCYSAQTSDITDVMVRGRFLKKNRKHQTLDVEEIRREVAERTARILKEME